MAFQLVSQQLLEKSFSGEVELRSGAEKPPFNVGGQKDLEIITTENLPCCVQIRKV